MGLCFVVENVQGIQIRHAWKRGHARFVIIPTTWLDLHHIEAKFAVLGFRLLSFTVMVDFFPAETLKIHTNAHAVRGSSTPKNVERQFRNGSFHESLESQKNSNELKRAAFSKSHGHLIT